MILNYQHSRKRKSVVVIKKMFQSFLFLTFRISLITSECIQEKRIHV